LQPAIRYLTAIKKKGLKVPEDISLAGFDETDFAAYCDPPLTTVRVPAFEGTMSYQNSTGNARKWSKPYLPVLL
jgi:hypothetical protein